MSEKSKPDQSTDAGLPSSWEGMLEEASATSKVPVETRAQVAGAIAVRGAERQESRDELIERLRIEPKYGECLDTLRHYGFLTEESINLPSLEMVLSAFTQEKLEIAGSFRKPTLLIIPNNSFTAKVKAMNAHKYGRHIDDIWVDSAYGKSDLSDKITGWRVAMVEGKHEADSYEGDRMDLTLKTRIKNRKYSRRPGENGMDRNTYISLMMDAVRKGTPVDQAQFTILDDDSILSESEMPFAGFDQFHRRPDFLKCATNACDDFTIFRSSVEADLMAA
jgi:hypothetical protein